MSYYHTYRPQEFKDLIGQDHIRLILQTAVATDRLVHAYLFCGTRGTGKTTTARLLAKLINCTAPVGTAKTLEPCNQCAICSAINSGSSLDVIEIDAASNRGIEEIRQLQDQARFKPQQAKKKIFIIDEVHMLTKEAFNALLKTLEEPPTHLMFILATTESHKLPATILSRCQRFDFLTPSSAVIGEYLRRMAAAEKLASDPAALVKLSELAHGSFRDSATILEQLATNEGKITAEKVTTMLGLPDEELVERYLKVLSGQIDPVLVEDLNQFFRRGGSAVAFIDASFTLLEKQLKSHAGLADPGQIMAVLVRLKTQLKQSPSADLPLLVAIYPKTDNLLKPIQRTSPVKPSPNPEDLPIKTQPVNQVVIIEETPAVETNHQTAVVTIEVAEQVPPVELPDTALSDKWQTAIGKLATESQSSLVAILRTARPVAWRSPALHVSVQFKFHADQLGRQKNRAILESLFAELLGGPVRLEFEIQPTEDLAQAAAEIEI